MATTATSLFDDHVRVDVPQGASVVAAPGEPTAFVIEGSRENVANYARENNDLIIEFNDGRVLRIRNFFAHGGNYNDLIFESGGGGSYESANFAQAMEQGGDGIVDQLVSNGSIAGSDIGLLGIVGGVAAGGGLLGLALASGGNKGSSPSAPVAPVAPKDTTPPAAPTLTLNDGDGDNRVTATGAAEPGATVTVTWPDGSTATAVADGAGNWSVESASPQGSGTVTAVARDAAGNTSAPATQIYTDTTAPAQTVTITGYTDDVAALTGSFGSGTVTNDAAPVLNGTLSAGLVSGEVVRIYDGATLIGTANVAGTTWTFDLPALADGSSHSYTAVVEDAAGNAGAASSVFTLTVDSSAPAQTVALISYTDDVTGGFGLRMAAASFRDDVASQAADFGSDTVTNDATPVLNGTLSAGLAVGEVVRIYEGATLVGAANVVGTAWTFSLPALANGSSHSYTAVVVDAAGNEGPASGVFTLTVDTAAPSLTLTLGHSDGNRAEASGTAEPGATVTVTWPDGSTATAMADGAGNWSMESAAPQASGLVTAMATDAAGNTSALVTQTYSDTAPAVQALTVSDGDGDNQVTASGTAEPGATVTVTWPDGSTATVVADGSGNWSAESASPQGSGTVTVVATGLARNASAPVSKTYTDTSAPAAPTALTVSDGDGDNQVTASGTAEPGTTVTVTWPDGSTATVVADGSGNWSAESPGPQGSGPVTVVATDPAGNTSAPVTQTYTDTSVPAAPTALTVSDGDGDNQVTASGTAEPGTTVTVTWPDGSTATVVADGSGNWSAESPGPQGSGPVTVVATDPAGNTSAPVTQTYTDTSVPAAPTALTVSDGDGDNQVTASGTAEPGTTVTVTWPDGSTATVVADGSGNWSAELPGPQGSGPVTVVATDPAGNTSAPVTQTYTDTSVPAQTVTIDTYADDVLAVTGSFGSGTTTNDTTPVLNGTLGAGLGAGEVVRIYEGATLIGTANVVGTTWTFNLPALADGSIHSYTAVVEDAAGNQGTASSVFTVTVDTAAPADATAIAITAVSDDSGHRRATSSPATLH